MIPTERDDGYRTLVFVGVWKEVLYIAIDPHGFREVRRPVCARLDYQKR